MLGLQNSSYVQVHLFALFMLKLAGHQEFRAYLAHTNATHPLLAVCSWLVFDQLNTWEKEELFVASVPLDLAPVGFACCNVR